MLAMACLSISSTVSAGSPGGDARAEYFDLDSKIMGTSVPMSVILPPGYKKADGELPLLIHLHGGGMNRNSLTRMLPTWQKLWDAGDLPPLVMVSFSSGGGSWYGGAWEQFVIDELPAWAHQQFGKPLRDLAKGDPALDRAYAELPPTKPVSCQAEEVQ